MWKGLARFLILIALAITPVFMFSPIPMTGWDLNPFSVNITITVAPLGGPVVTNGVGATSITYNSARLNGEITDTGGENPAVTVFYGQTDGGTTPASWTTNASLGMQPLGTFYYDAGSLSENKTHYYRMRAVNAAGTDWADSSANFTTLIEPLSPPSTFTLIDLGAITITANWTLGAKSTYTMIRVSRSDYPALTTEGELVYYGDSTTANTSGYALDTTEYFFSAWGYGSDNVTYSAAYATATIGGEGMTGISAALDSLVTAMTDSSDLFFGLILLISLFALSIWRRDLVWVIAAGVVSLIIGLSWLDQYSGIGMAVIGLSVFQFFEALVLALGSGGSSKGLSRFKGAINTIKGWF